MIQAGRSNAKAMALVAVAAVVYSACGNVYDDVYSPLTVPSGDPGAGGTGAMGIDECAQGTDNCGANAECTDTPDSFTCTCRPGFTGNGITCTDIDECADGSAQCGTNAHCINQPGLFACICDVGYMGDGVTCTDIDECTSGADSCQPAETCINTVGSFMCECHTPNVSCSGHCAVLDSDSKNCGTCGNACSSYQLCFASTCVGTGLLRVSVTWSRDGDLNLFVTTPNGRTIYYGNQGADAGTDYGKMDRNDAVNKGPENIFWAINTTPSDDPPPGDYHICVKTSSTNPFNPALSATAPVAFTVTVQGSVPAPQIFPGSYTSDTQDDTQCTPTTSGYVTTINYL